MVKKLIDLLEFIFYNKQLYPSIFLKAGWLVYDTLVDSHVHNDLSSSSTYNSKTIQKLLQSPNEVIKVFFAIQELLTRIDDAIITIPQSLYQQFKVIISHLNKISRELIHRIPIITKNKNIKLFTLFTHLLRHKYGTWIQNLNDYEFMNIVTLKSTTDEYKPKADYFLEDDPNRAALLATHNLLEKVVDQNNWQYHNGYQKRNGNGYQHRPGNGYQQRNNNNNDRRRGIKPLTGNEKKLIKKLGEKGLNKKIWRGRAPNGAKNSKPCAFFHLTTCNKSNACSYNHVCACGSNHPLSQHGNNNST